MIHVALNKISYKNVKVAIGIVFFFFGQADKV